MRKQTLFILGAFLLIVALVVTGQFLLGNRKGWSPTSLENERSNIKVEGVISSPTESYRSSPSFITIDFGNGLMVKGETKAVNAYEALKTLASEKGLSLEVKQYKFGLIVEKIGEYANAKEQSWVYSVNGKPALIAADRYLIYPNDKVEWRYEKIKN